MCSTLAATAAARGRTLAACAWALLAMLCKEEAVLLPVILASIAWLRPNADRYTFTFTWPLIRKNILEYSDRTLTLAVAATLLAAARGSGSRPRPTTSRRRNASCRLRPRVRCSSSAEAA